MEFKDVENGGRVFSINYSTIKKIPKTPIENARLIDGFGLEGDLHAGNGLRQVTLHSIENIRKVKECPKFKKENLFYGAGDFFENITTQGINLQSLKIGSRLKISSDIIVEVSEIGKGCYRHCPVYNKSGGCIIPKEGIFAKIVRGGAMKIGDEIKLI